MRPWDRDRDAERVFGHVLDACVWLPAVVCLVAGLVVIVSRCG